MGEGSVDGPASLVVLESPAEQEAVEPPAGDVGLEAGQLSGTLAGEREHGVGIEKRDLMGTQFSDTDMDCQMQVKDVFDPNWLLNPAKVFPLALSAARRNRSAA